MEEAIREYEKEAELFPNSAQTHFELGELLLKKGAVERALKHLTAANQADPSLPDVYFARAKAYRDAEHLQQAISAARRCLELNQRFPDVHYLLSRLYRSVGDEEQARQHARVFEQMKAEIEQLETKYRQKVPTSSK